MDEWNIRCVDRGLSRCDAEGNDGGAGPFRHLVEHGIALGEILERRDPTVELALIEELRQRR